MKGDPSETKHRGGSSSSKHNLLLPDNNRRRRRRAGWRIGGWGSGRRSRGRERRAGRVGGAAGDLCAADGAVGARVEVGCTLGAVAQAGLGGVPSRFALGAAPGTSDTGKGDGSGAACLALRASWGVGGGRAGPRVWV